jgi:hypothetical protein
MRMFKSSNLQRRYHLEDLDVDGRFYYSYTLNKYVVRLSNGLDCRKIRSNDGPLLK